MIHNTAIVSSKARLGSNVQIGPYAIIGDHVELGDGSIVGPHAVIEGHTVIGKNNQVFQFASLGATPQDKKYHGEDTRLEIGDNNTFREFSTVHVGTVTGGGLTKIGDNNLLMNYVHIAHDCILGNGIVMANNASLAGHVDVGDYVTFGGFAKVAQFTLLGAYSFLVANADIGKDILPYVIAGGDIDSSKLYGLNLVGLRRHGFSNEIIAQLKEAYNIILLKKLRVVDAIVKLEELEAKCPAIGRMIQMLKTSQRGILR